MYPDEQLFLESYNPEKNYRGVKSFDCGEKIINDFPSQLKRQCGRDNIHAKVLVDDSDFILGFCTATLYQLGREAVPAQAYLYALPPTIVVVKIPMIGIDKKIQGSGWGKNLMQAVLTYALNAADSVSGIKGVYLDAKPERVGFYKLYGFEVIDEETNTGVIPMLLTIDKLRKAFAQRRESA